MKIGQEIVVSKDFEIETLGGKKLEVREGDKGYIDSSGSVHYYTGEAKGIIQKLKNIEIEGYDTGNIADIILKYLNYFDINNMLSDFDIEKQDFKERIEEALEEIL